MIVVHDGGSTSDDKVMRRKNSQGRAAAIADRQAPIRPGNEKMLQSHGFKKRRWEAVWMKRVGEARGGQLKCHEAKPASSLNAMVAED